MNYFLYFIPIALFMSYWYWNRARNVKKAGGAAEFYALQQRQMYGLPSGDGVTQQFSGSIYMGPLRPDVGPSKTEKVVDAVLGGITHRGLRLFFALTTQGRLSIAIEQDGTSVASLKGEGMGFNPYMLFASTAKPSVRLGEEAFAGHPKFPTEKDRPESGGGLGQPKLRMALINIDAPGQAPLTAWIDPLGAKALCAWSMLSPQATLSALGPGT